MRGRKAFGVRESLGKRRPASPWPGVVSQKGAGGAGASGGAAESTPKKHLTCTALLGGGSAFSTGQ